MKAKKKHNTKWYLLTTIQVIAGILLITSLGTLIYYQLDYDKGEKTYTETLQNYVQETPTQQVEEQSRFRKLEIDFDSLREKNKDIIGWIDCPNLNISYPVLQGTTDETYLRHMYTGEYNRSGSIFLGVDYQPDLSQAISIVYGHNMNNGTMFGGLMKFQEQAGYDPDTYFGIYLPGRKEPTYYRIVSFNKMAPDADFYFEQYELGSLEYQKFQTMVMASALYDTGFAMNPNLTTLALSTCTSDGNNRLVAFCQKILE